MKYILYKSYGGFLYSPSGLLETFKRWILPEKFSYMAMNDPAFRCYKKTIEFFEKNWDKMELGKSYKIVEIPYPPEELVIEECDGYERIMKKGCFW